MIDLGLSKLAVIGVIALVVLGPERLPKVARTVGTLLGRAQRYIADVKSEVSREMDLDELRRMQTDVRDAAQTFESKIHAEFDQTGKDLEAAFGDRSIAPPEAERAELDEPPGSRPPRPTARSPAKRKNWRVRQSATPLWFRKASRTRSRVQSGAARVARYRVKVR